MLLIQVLYMSRILSFPNFGRMKVYDLNDRVDMMGIRNDLKTLSCEKHSRIIETRRKVIHFQYQKPNTFIRSTNHTRYPEYFPSDVIQFSRLLQIYSKIEDIPDNGNISIEAQRITCEPGSNNSIDFDIWNKNMASKAGIFCINKCNVQGGVLEFCNEDKINVSVTLRPGHIVIFDSNSIQHRVTHINSKNGKASGYHDVMLFSCP